MSSFSVTSHMSSYSAPPATPSNYSSEFPSSSPSIISLNTPPESIRKYSHALKAIMTQGMTAAMADMKDDARDAERQFDVEFGYDDEDPIERHVRLHLTPRKRATVLPPTRLGQPQHQLHVEVEQEVDMQRDEAELEIQVQPFRPGLIHFNRSSRHSMPSFSRLNSNGISSGTSTPNPRSCSDYFESDTPGSDWSEASFEAIKTDDVISMYGNASTSQVDRSSLASAVSTSSDVTARSTSLDKRPCLVRPQPRAHPYGPSGEREGAEESGVGPALEPSEGDWLSGRTVSEQMVAQAGLRCQRERNARTVGEAK